MGNEDNSIRDIRSDSRLSYPVVTNEIKKNGNKKEIFAGVSLIFLLACLAFFLSPHDLFKRNDGSNDTDKGLNGPDTDLTSNSPTTSPSELLTLEPTTSPTLEPTTSPTLEPTASPTPVPTTTPSIDTTGLYDFGEMEEVEDIVAEFDGVFVFGSDEDNTEANLDFADYVMDDVYAFESNNGTTNGTTTDESFVTGFTSLVCAESEGFCNTFSFEYISERPAFMSTLPGTTLSASGETKTLECDDDEYVGDMMVNTNGTANIAQLDIKCFLLEDEINNSTVLYSDLEDTFSFCPEGSFAYGMELVADAVNAISGFTSIYLKCRLAELL